MAFQAPVVDALSVRVVVDSRYERFLAKASHAQVRIEKHYAGPVARSEESQRILARIRASRLVAGRFEEHDGRF